MIKVFWHQSSNFGDNITPYILDKIGIDYVYTPSKINRTHYIMCGSVLPAANEHSIIWGAGIAQDAEDINWIQPKEILAVRGELTRKMLLEKGIKCPKVYGDPAMLLPHLYPKEHNPTKKCGYVGNIIDHRISDISITLPVEKFIDELLQYEAIQTSSLHALITASVYGLKAEWYPCHEVIGGSFKFLDFINTEYDHDKYFKCFPYYKQIRGLLQRTI